MYEYGYRDNKFDLVNQYNFISSLTHDFLWLSTSEAHYSRKDTDPVWKREPLSLKLYSKTWKSGFLKKIKEFLNFFASYSTDQVSDLLWLH